MSRFRAAAPLLLLLVAFAGCTGDSDEDNDGDGLPDSFERDGWDVEFTLLGGDEDSRHVTSNPKRVDSDGDGLGDSEEAFRRLDPKSPDTDEDGLLDGASITLDADDAKAGTWTEAGIVAEEQPGGSLKFLGETQFHTEPTDQDSDLPEPDGLMDGDEARGFQLTILGDAVTVKTDPFSYDSDGDFVGDGKEVANGLHPDDADTEGDGVPDGDDLDPLRNLRLEVRFESVRFLRDKDTAEPLKAADFFVDVYAHFDVSAVRTGEADIAENADADIASLSLAPFDIDDRGGDFAGGQFNISVRLAGFDSDAGGPAQVDLAAGSASEVTVQFNVRTGKWVLGAADPASGTITAQGDDARLRFVLRAV